MQQSFGGAIIQNSFSKRLFLANVSLFPLDCWGPWKATNQALTDRRASCNICLACQWGYVEAMDGVIGIEDADGPPSASASMPATPSSVACDPGSLGSGGEEVEPLPPVVPVPARFQPRRGAQPGHRPLRHARKPKVRYRKGNPKNFCDKDVAELSGELSGANCLKALVLLGSALELFGSFFGAVRAIFWLWGSFLAPDRVPRLLGCYGALPRQFQPSKWKLAASKIRLTTSNLQFLYRITQMSPLSPLPPSHLKAEIVLGVRNRTGGAPQKGVTSGLPKHQKSEEGCASFFHEHACIAGMDNVRGSVDPGFDAALPFLKPKSKDLKHVVLREELFRCFCEILPEFPSRTLQILEIATDFLSFHKTTMPPKSREGVMQRTSFAKGVCATSLWCSPPLWFALKRQEMNKLEKV